MIRFLCLLLAAALWVGSAPSHAKGGGFGSARSTGAPGHASRSTSELPPGTKAIAPELQAEIDRGVYTSSDCSVAYPVEVAAFAKCVRAAYADNLERGTASDGFGAGLFFAGWLSRAIDAEMLKTPGMDLQLARAATEEFFQRANEIRQKLEFEVGDLCAATHRSWKAVGPLWAISSTHHPLDPFRRYSAI